MKLATTISRYLLGLLFTVFGLNGFFHFIPQPPPVSPLALQYFGAVSASHYIAPVFALQLLCGLLLLAGRYVPLALTVLAGIIFNILVFHIAMDPGGIGAGIFVAILWVLVFAGYRASFAPLFRAQPEGL
jgi:uncharacterized membrane protein YphA (DoxX/SURF4 family)